MKRLSILPESYFLRLKGISIDLLRAVAGVARSPFVDRKFGIKAGYHHREKERYFNDTENRDEYQKEVYEKALEIMHRKKLHSIIDIGCGSAYKLMKYFKKHHIVGIEVAHTLAFLKQEYPLGNWLDDQGLDYGTLTADLIICADVIEHLQRPDLLLEKIRQIKDWQFLLISTPDRDSVRTPWTYGPPTNEFHLREWTMSEFARFISSHFQVETHYLSNPRQGTQLLICSPLKKPTS